MVVDQATTAIHDAIAPVTAAPRTNRNRTAGAIARITAGTTASQATTGGVGTRTIGATPAIDSTSVRKPSASMPVRSAGVVGHDPRIIAQATAIVDAITKAAKTGVTMIIAGIPTIESLPNDASASGAVAVHATTDADATIAHRSRTIDRRRRPTPSIPVNQR